MPEVHSQGSKMAAHLHEYHTPGYTHLEAVGEAQVKDAPDLARQLGSWYLDQALAVVLLVGTGTLALYNC